MSVITSLRARNVFNSHVALTTEFVLELCGQSTGSAASPQGETISIYEDKHTNTIPEYIIADIVGNHLLHTEQSQETFDQFLRTRFSTFGRNNCYALSLAFHAASLAHDIYSAPPTVCNSAEKSMPKICFNILNGGRYAYTNPVLSDFPEYLLVANANDIYSGMTMHNDIQALVKESLVGKSKQLIGTNTVNVFTSADNRSCIEFLLGILERLGFSNDFVLMIDASAGDLWREGKYCLSITDKSEYSSEGFYEYWRSMINQYQIGFLEDPFCERDHDAWFRLTTDQTRTSVIGDNFYSSSADRIREGASSRYSHGVIIKPNQAGTVSDTLAAITAAQEGGLTPITSHRSISTESTYVAEVTCDMDVPYIKIGPLTSDYSSVMRLNALIRRTQD